MTRINLLPWREARREADRKRFLLVLGGVVLLSAGSIVLGDRYINHAIERQAARNAYLGQQISALEERAGQLDELKSRRAQLIERMQVIQSLQGQRSGTAQIFEQLARTLPDEVYFTDLQWRDRRLVISGMAASNQGVAELLRNLDATDVLGVPRLTEIKAAGDGSGSDAASLFSLTVPQAEKRLMVPGP